MQTDTNALPDESNAADATLTTLTTTPIAEYSPVAAVLGDLKTLYGNAVFDVTTRTGMSQAKDARAHLRTLRTDLEKTRKEIKAPALLRCRQIDGEAARITAVLEDLEHPIDDQIKSEELRKEAAKEAAAQASRERIEKVNRMFEDIRSRVGRAAGQPLEVIDALLTAARAVDAAEFPEDMRAAADYERQLAINALMAERDRREQADKDAAELARLRAEREERERELQALRQAEADRIAAAQRLEDERIAAEQAAQREREEADRIAREREQAAQAERERIEREQRAHEAAERADQEKRERNKKHVAKVNKAAIEAMVGIVGIAQTQAAELINAIAAGEIPAVTITY